jgi:hypothetical protein
MPASRLQLGMFHKASVFAPSQLVGVIVFSVPVQERAIPSWLDGLNPRLGVELGRLVLDEACPGNSESWMLGRSFSLLRILLPEVEGVLSYCDPMERRAADGTLVKPGHRGVIYKAHNGRHAGVTKPRTLVLSQDGRCASERALSKVRHDEQGAAYAQRQLIDLGAPPRKLLESGSDYIARALREGKFRRVRHPGHFCFTWWVRGQGRRGHLNGDIAVR